MAALKTLDDVKAMLTAFTEQHGKEAPDDDNALFFCARIEARLFNDMTTRDVANIILEGYPALTKERLPEWLDTFYDNDTLSMFTEEEQKALTLEKDGIDQDGCMIDWQAEMKDFYFVE